MCLCGVRELITMLSRETRANYHFTMDDVISMTRVEGGAGIIQTEWRMDKLL